MSSGTSAYGGGQSTGVGHCESCRAGPPLRSLPLLLVHCNPSRESAELSLGEEEYVFKHASESPHMRPRKAPPLVPDDQIMKGPPLSLGSPNHLPRKEQGSAGTLDCVQHYPKGGAFYARSVQLME